MKKFLILSLVLSGCASPQGYWYKEGLTQEEYAKTKYLCLQQAQQPESHSSYSAVPVSSGMGEANRMSNAMREGFLAGLNSSSKMVTNDTLFSACMNAHGLYWKVEK